MGGKEQERASKWLAVPYDSGDNPEIVESLSRVEIFISIPETKLPPFPALEIKMSKHAVLNISGSPQVGFADQKKNAVLFFQYKLQLR